MTLLDYQTLVPQPAVRANDILPADDPFFYGWREVPHRTNGTEELVRVPLTLADVLHPQLGDYIVQGYLHGEASNDLLDGLKGWLAHEPGTVVVHDLQIDWEDATIKPMCPDITVIRNTTVPPPYSTFYVKQYGGSVDVVVEITSPSTWKVDVDGYDDPNKVQLYAKLGVKVYIIVDTAHQHAGQSPPISAFQLGPDGTYQRIDPDARGWCWIDILGLWIGPYQDWISWYDADGNKIGTYVEENKARKRAEKARKRAEEKAQHEADARKRADEARTLAEEKAQHEADARKRADEARTLAEEKAQHEADARKHAEERIRQLEAMLRTQKEQ